ncbi:MAG: efflux RND transporter periplasmic adaptor subunit, partial [Deltaproteobacteria bacterium]
MTDENKTNGKVEDLEQRIERVVRPGRKRSKSGAKSGLRPWLAAVLLLVGLGVGLFVGRTYLAPGTAQSTAAVQESRASGEEEKTKYTCGMHPQIVQDEPGFCPICGMKLTPMKQEKKKKKKIVTGEAACKGKKILWYQAPMDPTYRSPEPGKSPMGMDLVPACEGEGEESAEGISVDSRIRQNMGIRLAEVKELPLVKTIRTVGHVDYDERRLAIINTKIDGWVEKLNVDFTGQWVKKGQVLLSIYSPKLIATQQELLIAARQHRAAPSRRTETMLEAARQRLRYWDIPDAQISRIEQGGKIQRRLSIRSPISGVVVKKNVLEGQHVMPGTTLFEVADLRRVWVLAHVYEMDAPFVKVGQRATIELPYAPDAGPVEGTVEYVYPWLNEKSRDLRVRLAFENPG